MIVCLGPVCIPLWGVLPLLLGWFHNMGWFKWVKAEWVNYRWWKQKIYKRLGWATEKKDKVCEKDEKDEKGTAGGSVTNPASVESAADGISLSEPESDKTK
mmetsp:Transcript_36016/g.60690  ORF Transcript_36016/g.60690 Transcript_36016/m.60690 type:complete len:101 (-) Transcript_36016:395-697(-)|eukprot:CAMPEP_0198204918 /NCGR_PEP_ID=MMETSP1445-20131203/8399_1 /TAXON_ID=36898 /ORGANISM="Pyramimonas sp., Strain CCMP2087" /LENGTH=100 /DNA_ID=CAMNT_0043877011 /DNA_START=185 /DNA_END=487 /DNA_ORIENTATION=+